MAPPAHSQIRSVEVLPVEKDLIEEKASSLAHTAEKLEAALRALAEVERALAAAPVETAAELARRRQEVREIAAERLWFLLVQREAIGLNHHDAVFRVYDVPPDLRVSAGPRLSRRAGSPAP